MNTIISTDLNAAKLFLEDGNVIGIPTETVYGLAGNALDEDAVLKIFSVKGRPHFDPLIVHTHSLEELSKYVEEIPEKAEILFKIFSPGPVTVLLKKKETIPDLVTSGLNTVAFRIPNHPLTLQLLRQIDFPLAAPSANPFGYISPTSSYHVYDQLHGRIPMILEGGVTEVGVESTIVGFENGETVIYRLGGISVEEIEKEIGSVEIAVNEILNPKAAGMMKHHYAPKKKLVIGELANELKNEAGVIAFDKYVEGINRENQILLSEKSDLKEAAKNLFAAMRKLDASDVKIIYALSFPDVGLGRAINDRLNRAAS